MNELLTRGIVTTESKDSEIGEIPASWSLWKAEDCVRRPMAYGVLKPGPHMEDGVPLIRIVDVGEAGIIRTELHRISRDLDDEFKRTRNASW